MLSSKDNPNSFYLGLIPSSLFTALIVNAWIRMAARRPLPAASLWLHAILLLLAGNSPIAPFGTCPAEAFAGWPVFGRMLVYAPVLLYPLGRRAAPEPRLSGFAWRLASTRRR